MKWLVKRIAGIVIGSACVVSVGAQTTGAAGDSPLRVLVVPAYTGYKKNLSVPYPEFYRRNLDKATQALSRTGYAQVVPPEEADAVAGKDRERFSRKATHKVLRETAAKLGAEYSLSVVLNFDSNAGNEWRITLIGTESGSLYTVKARPPAGVTNFEFGRISRAAIDRIFQDAREDMLAAAIRKRGGGSGPEAAAAAAPGRPVEIERDLDILAAEREAAAVSARQPIAVPDLEGEEQNRTARRILSEALRYELLAQGKFRIVEREKLDAIMREIELQAAGLASEDQAVRIGEAAAAKQIVIGSAAALGSLAVIQVRRIDLESQLAVGAGALTYEAGKEIEALKGMPSLAKELARDR